METEIEGLQQTLLDHDLDAMRRMLTKASIPFEEETVGSDVELRIFKQSSEIHVVIVFDSASHSLRDVCAWE
jgi:hypothetical protein